MQVLAKTWNLHICISCAPSVFSSLPGHRGLHYYHSLGISWLQHIARSKCCFLQKLYFFSTSVVDTPICLILKRYWWVLCLLFCPLSHKLNKNKVFLIFRFHFSSSLIQGCVQVLSWRNMYRPRQRSRETRQYVTLCASVITLYIHYTIFKKCREVCLVDGTEN